MTKLSVFCLLILTATTSYYSQSKNPYKIIGPSNIATLISTMNVEGKNGYKLEKIGKYPISSSRQNAQSTMMLAVLKYEQNEQHQYDWFIAATPGVLQSTMNEFGNHGFYFKEAVQFADQLCVAAPTITDKSEIEVVLDRARYSLSFTYGSIFVVEKNVSISKKFEYRVAVGVFGSNSEAQKELTDEMSGHVERGFDPVAMVPFKISHRYAVSILSELDPSKSDRSTGYEVVVTEFGFEKKINQLAKKGHRLLFAGRNSAKKFALLTETQKQGLSYEFIDTRSKKKFIDKKESVFSAAEYRFTSYDLNGCDFAKNTIALAKPSTTRSLTTNTRIIPMKQTAPAHTFRETDDINEWKALEAEINELASKGLVFQDLFYSSGFHAIFQGIE